MRILVALAALALTTAGGCDLARLVSSPTPDALVKPTHGPIELRTATSPIPSAPCPVSGIEGMLIEHDGTGLGLLVKSTGLGTAVVWPTGYRAGPTIAGGILFDASGQLVAYTGESLRIQAFQAAPDGPLLVCGVIQRLTRM